MRQQELLHQLKWQSSVFETLGEAESGEYLKFTRTDLTLTPCDL